MFERGEHRRPRKDSFEIKTHMNNYGDEYGGIHESNSSDEDGGTDTWTPRRGQHGQDSGSSSNSEDEDSEASALAQQPTLQRSLRAIRMSPRMATKEEMGRKKVKMNFMKAGRPCCRSRDRISSSDKVGELIFDDSPLMEVCLVSRMHRAPRDGDRMKTAA